jgi:hypothetical protein
MFGISMDTIIQDQLQTVPFCPILSNSARNIDQTRTGGKSIVQLGIARFEVVTEAIHWEPGRLAVGSLLPRLVPDFPKAKGLWQASLAQAFQETILIRRVLVSCRHRPITYPFYA